MDKTVPVSRTTESPLTLAEEQVIIQSLIELPPIQFYAYSGDVEECIKTYKQKFGSFATVYLYKTKPHGMTFLYFTL